MILSSVGDLLQSAADLSDVEPTATTFYTTTGSIPTLFSGESMPLDYSISKINGLVNEFTKVVDGVGSRFPYGLGHYMLMKAEAAMKVKGILKVDKIQGKAGNWVMVDSHTVGLSGKMDTFEGLAVRMNAYEAALAALTAKLSSKKPASITKPTRFHVEPPEWPGN